MAAPGGGSRIETRGWGRVSIAEARVDFEGSDDVNGSGWRAPTDPENQLPIAPDEHGIGAVADALGCDRRLVAAWWSDFVRQRLVPPGSTTGPQSAAAVPVPLRKPATTAPAGSPARADLREQAAWLDGLKQAARDGDPEATERQHAKGKLTARERLDLLLDAGSFVELDLFARHTASGFGLDDRRPATDGVVTGWGTVHGRQVFVFAQDFRIFGGALGETYARKIHKVMDSNTSRCSSRLLASSVPVVVHDLVDLLA